MGDDTRAGVGRTFVLRLRAGGRRGRQGLRIDLEDPETRARREFSSFREFARFAAGLFGSVPDGSQALPSRDRGRRRRASAILALLLPCGLLAADPPSLGLGEGGGVSGSTVAVPLRLRSTDGVAIGALSLRLAVEPASAVESIRFRRAGSWSGRAVAFEARPQAGASYSWIVTLSEPAPAETEVLVGEVVVGLSEPLAPGTTVLLRLDPAVSGFGDRAGTLFVSAASGGLALTDGTIRVSAHDARRRER